MLRSPARPDQPEIRLRWQKTGYSPGFGRARIRSIQKLLILVRVKYKESKRIV